MYFRTPPLFCSSCLALLVYTVSFFICCLDLLTFGLHFGLIASILDFTLICQFTFSLELYTSHYFVKLLKIYSIYTEYYFINFYSFSLYCSYLILNIFLYIIFNVLFFLVLFQTSGGAKESRTLDLLLARQALQPTELQPHKK